MITVDRFAEFFRDIRGAYSKKRADRISKKKLEKPSKQFFEALIENAPEWEDAPGQERPSTRIWSTTLSKSFVAPEIEEGIRIHGQSNPSIGGAVAKFMLDHPSVDGEWDSDIVEWLIYGTKPHLVPNDPQGDTAYFWWGEPLKWHPPGNWKHGLYGEEGKEWGTSTFTRGYWAQPGLDFIAEAERESADLFIDAFEDAANEVLREPLSKSTLLRKRK